MCDCQCKGNAPVAVLKGELVIDAKALRDHLRRVVDLGKA